MVATLTADLQTGMILSSARDDELARVRELLARRDAELDDVRTALEENHAAQQKVRARLEAELSHVREDAAQRELALSRAQAALDTALSALESEHARAATQEAEFGLRLERSESARLAAQDRHAALERAAATAAARADQMASAKDAAVAQLHQSQTRVLTLEGDLAKSESTLAAERSIRADLERDVKQLGIAQGEVQMTLAAMIRNWREAEETLAGVLASRSWRLTARFRRDRPTTGASR
jgi:chromosome segregation ATPase